jgi:hypothetical protein
MEREKMRTNYWRENLKEANRLEDLGADGNLRTGLSVQWNGGNMWGSCGTAICTRRGLFHAASDVNTESIYRGMVQTREWVLRWVHMSGYALTVVRAIRLFILAKIRDSYRGEDLHWILAKKCCSRACRHQPFGENTASIFRLEVLWKWRQNLRGHIVSLESRFTLKLRSHICPKH